MRIACARCQKVLALEVQVEDVVYDADSPEDVDVRLPGGRLTAVCVDCTTEREARQLMMELSAKMLEINEEYVKEVEGVGAIVPAILDDPKVKVGLVRAREAAEEARERLRALATIDAADEERS